MSALASDVAPDRTADMSVLEKIGEAISRSPRYVLADVQADVRELCQPENLVIIIPTLELWAASQFFVVGEIVDALVAAAAVVAEAVALGATVIACAWELSEF